MLETLQEKLKIKFKNPAVLQNALTHRSWVNEHKNLSPENNERLEFLGDAILEFWVTRNLFNEFPRLSEGVLTNIRASLVCTEALAEKSHILGISEFICLGKGEEQGGGRENPSLLADAFEAVIGAIFVDQGLTQIEKFLESLFAADLKRAGNRGDIKDAKTLLQEIAQEREKATPQYEVVEELGPEHLKKFRVAVLINGQKIATGEGRSKKEAEEHCAREALTLYAEKDKIQSLK